MGEGLWRCIYSRLVCKCFKRLRRVVQESWALLVLQKMFGVDSNDTISLRNDVIFELKVRSFHKYPISNAFSQFDR